MNIISAHVNPEIKEVPFEFRWKTFEVIEATPQHTYLICTKRLHNMANFIQEWLMKKPILYNCFLGCTIETQKWADKRIPELLKCQPFKLFLSIEPLLDLIHFDRWMVASNRPFTISQVIIGAESGPNRRPCKSEWVESLVEQCRMMNIPVWVKQLDIGGKLIRDINQFPKHLQIRELAWKKS